MEAAQLKPIVVDALEELKAQDAAVQQLQQAAVKDVGAAEGSARADDENKE